MIDRAQEMPTTQHDQTSQRLYADAQPSAPLPGQRPRAEEPSVLTFGHTTVELMAGSKAAIVTNNDSGSITQLNSQGQVDFVIPSGNGLVDFNPATGKVKDVFTTDGTTVQFDPKTGKPDEIIKTGRSGGLSYFKYDAATGKATPDPQHKP
jgi:hypothetical protein